MSALDIDVHKVLLTEVCQDWSEDDECTRH